ncbi:MAG: SCO family protein [Candidimonas sp.]|jgi:protein SCO1/2
MTRSMSRRNFLSALFAAGLSLHGCSRSGRPERFHGKDLTGADFGRDFLLTGTDGKPYSLSDFGGNVVMLFFGFTQCPDVCPTALLRAAQAKELLGKDGERLQVLFITIDPERDTPGVLDAYTHAFDPSFRGLYGDLEQTARTAEHFRVFYQKVPTGSSYTMDHSAIAYVYDRRGELRLGLHYSQTAQECADDIRQLL